MKLFEFTLKFALPKGELNSEIYVEQLATSGCDDALIGIGQPGKIALQFTRKANGANEAILSAIGDVKKAIPYAHLTEATPDLVGITDIAELLGFSRQNIRKLILNHTQDFPSPVHEGKSSIWHLSNVLKWFQEDRQRPVDPTLLETAYTTMQVNLAKEATNLDSRLHSQMTALIS